MSNPSEANAGRFTGFADIYDKYRPRPPQAVVDLLTHLAGAPRPRLVVDLGCGTGLSTRMWADVAEAVIGIEPSDDMREEAGRRTTAPNVSYRRGFAHATKLPDASADIVTCSQSLHWMDPEPTFLEVRRITRPGGVFAAIDCDWPPHTPAKEVEQAYMDTMDRRLKLAARIGQDTAPRWSKEEHLARMRRSGLFTSTQEVVLHHTEMGSADRIVGLALSMGSVQKCLKAGVSGADLGLDDLRTIARRAFGEASVPWSFTYRVRIGVV
jgi:ubiquinone/menaquinone biosynthesis C-methylase UbiE